MGNILTWLHLQKNNFDVNNKYDVDDDDNDDDGDDDDDDDDVEIGRAHV